MAPRAATAPKSIAERDASAPPGWPSPRLPPIHSAIGVRAPETMTMSGRLLVGKGLLLVVEDSIERVGARCRVGRARGGRGARGRHATIATGHRSSAVLGSKAMRSHTDYLTLNLPTR